MKWIILALIILVVLLVLQRITTPRAEKDPYQSSNLRPGTNHDIDQLVANGQKIAAVRKLRATDPTLSLRDAKARIDSWEPENKPYSVAPGAQHAPDAKQLPPHVIVEIDQAIAAGETIKAVKVLREHTNLGLLEAKKRIDQWVPGRN
ncbi:hypothetical protein [Glutamicibacter uratoxydans]|uniref:hypothetical protein n=1 Tax=Glutamicibacter uratoxydans TaxID=43667 RepID=UPI003D6E170F